MEYTYSISFQCAGMGCLRWLLKVKSALSWECGGNAKSLVSAIESQAGLHAVDAGKASKKPVVFSAQKMVGYLDQLVTG